MLPKSTAEAMRMLAAWIDEVADPCIDKWFGLHGVDRDAGDDTQRDLRAWADYIEAHPELDADLFAVASFWAGNT